MVALQPAEFIDANLHFQPRTPYGIISPESPPPPFSITNILPSTLLFLRARAKRGAENALHVSEFPLHMDQG